jgi:hypothetical protein
MWKKIKIFDLSAFERSAQNSSANAEAVRTLCVRSLSAHTQGTQGTERTTKLCAPKKRTERRQTVRKAFSIEKVYAASANAEAVRIA